MITYCHRLSSVGRGFRLVNEGCHGVWTPISAGVAAQHERERRGISNAEPEALWSPDRTGASVHPPTQGFCSASLLVDRSSGRLVASVTLDSRAALDHGREQAARLRAQGAEQTGAAMVDVGEFELALAHLRIPEMA